MANRAEQKDQISDRSSEEESQEKPTEEEIDRTLKDSFPASDPPSWTLGIDDREEPKDDQE